VALVLKRTIPTERPPLVGIVSAPTSADRGCHVVSVTDPYGHILWFQDRTTVNTTTMSYYQYRIAELCSLLSILSITAIEHQTGLCRGSTRIKNSVAWVCEQTILTKRPPLVGKISFNFWFGFSYFYGYLTLRLLGSYWALCETCCILNYEL
jgi:hypothetical protein